MRRSSAEVALLLSLACCLVGCPDETGKGGKQAGASGAPPATAAASTAASTAAAPDTGPAPNAPKADPDLQYPMIMDSPTGKYGGTITMPAYEDPKTFNPPMMFDATSQRFGTYLFDQLVDEDGVTFNVVPELAKSWEISPDGTQYTFHMRKGAKWQDGQPITADDVVFTYMDVLANKDIPWDARDVVTVDGKLPVVTKADDYTVVVKLPKVFSPFLRAGAAAIPILPKHVYAKWVQTKGPDGKPVALSKWAADSDLTKIVGSGAWMVESYQPGQRIVLKRNPHYYRENRHHQPLPYADRLVVPFLKTVETAILKFKAGETDGQWLPGNSYAYMKPLESQGHFHIVNAGPDFRTTYLSFNLNPGKRKDGKPIVDPVKLKWFADTRFRQAISYSIDRQAIINNIFRGLAAEQNSPIFQRSPYYDPTVPQYKLDRDKAMQLLTEAGFKKDGNVLKDKDGHPVTFTMLHDVGSKDLDMRANMIKEDLAKLGIDVKFRDVTFNVKLAAEMETKDWECEQGDWGAGIEPHGVVHLWESNGQRHFFDLNPSETRNPNPNYPWEKRIDELFDEGASTIDETKRKQIYSEFQQLVCKEQVLIFLPVFDYTIGVRDNLGNAKPSPYSPVGLSWNSWELYRK